MSKKNFKGGLDSLLGAQPKKQPERKKAGRPKTSTRIVEKSSQEGTKENETRATFIVNEDLLEKFKAIAYWDRALIKDMTNSALGDYITKYEKKNGSVKPIPKKG
jgi:hypothetical protein